jgi:DNA-binding transcriptional regulator YdaS (Cro superfamily)
MRCIYTAEPVKTLLAFEKHIGLGPVATARVLGCAYPTYAQYRSGLRELPQYQITQIKAVTRLTPEALAEHIQEMLDGTS